MKKTSIIYSKKGISLLETIVALTIVIISLGALLSLYAQSLGIQSLVSDRYKAIFLTNQGIEVVKNSADNAFLSGGFPSAIASAQSSASAVSLPLGGSYSRFDRSVLVSNISAERFKIEADVIWWGKNNIQHKIRGVYFVYNTNLHD